MIRKLFLDMPALPFFWGAAFIVGWCHGWVQSL